MSIASGTQIGPYSVTSPLGAGGMGDVYRARDTRLGRDVALKVLPASFSIDPDRLQRFEQEARAAAALNHPNILVLHDIGSFENGPYLVTELLEGDTLRELLAAGPLPIRKAVDYAVQIARGLAAAHERGIVHRDIKPENVFVTRDGVVKILDFGLAKLRPGAARDAGAEGQTVTARGTEAGTVLGTVGYMSPEQVRGEPTDHRSDLFSLGAVIYEMVSGQRAFRADTAAETMTAILRAHPPELSRSTAAVPALDRIVSRCLEKQPSARFKSADDLAFALETLSSSSSASSATVPARPAGSQPALLRRALPWAVAAVSAVAALAGWFSGPVPEASGVIRFSMLAPAGWRLDLAPAGVGIPLAVSPNGRFIAGLAWNPRGHNAIWVRGLDEVEPRILPGTEQTSTIFWSPDSRSLGFFANGWMQKIDPAGRSVGKIAQTEFPFGAAWSSTGFIAFGSRTGVYKVSAEGGTPELAIPLREGEAFHTMLWFLPDGDRFFMTVGLGNQVRAGAIRVVSVASLSSPARTEVFQSSDDNQVVVPVAITGERLLFLRGNTVMAQSFDSQRVSLSGETVTLVDRVQTVEGRPFGVLSASRTGLLAYVPLFDAAVHQLAWVDRSGRVSAEIGERGNYTGVEVSADDRRAIVAVLDEARRTRDIWLFDLTRAVRTRFTFDPGEERSAIWSPDGQTVVYNAQRKAVERELYARPADGSGKESVVLADGLSKDPMSWSPDGRFLLYRTSSAAARNDIWVQPMSGDRKPYPFAANPWDDNYGRFSPDGRWVAYVSDESGRTEVLVVPFPGPGGKWQVSTDGGSYPRWNSNGRELFYLALDNRVMSVPIESATTTFVTGAPQPLFVAQVPSQQGYQYTVGRDGTRFLVNTTATQTAAVTVISNWPSLVKP